MLAPGHYQILLSAFWQAGFSVAGLHFSGHGELLQEEHFSFRTLTGEALKAEAWLCENGYGPVAVCGHSQGGIIALAHGSESGTLAGVFSLCAALPAMQEAIGLTRFARFARYRKQVMDFLRRGAAIFPSLPVPLPLYLEIGRIISGKRKPAIMGSAKGRLSYPLSYLVSLFEANIPEDIKSPFWLCAAKNDALFTQELTEAVFSRINAPAKTLFWLGDGGHMFPMNPGLAEITARQIACECAGLGMRLEI